MERRSNKFKKAIHHLKSKQIDEKLEMLNEIPTNNAAGIYIVEPDYMIQDPDIPGDVTREVNFTQDALVNGRDTTGLFDTDGTTILTIEPPGDTSYILGPMASMWYAWGNFSTIGYIRQSDRRMVDLGRIIGQLENWNGTGGSFISYGQLTLPQADWFRTTPKYENYRAFYPGPPSNAPDQYGRYLCVITGTSKSTTETPPPRRVPPVLGPFDPNLPPGSANPYLTDKPLPPDILGDLAILGLSAAVVAALKVALASGAVTALLSRLRYLAKLRMDRGALNPFGQTSVRSGAAGRQRVDVYTGRPYQGPRGNRTGTQYGTPNQQTGNTYTNPGPLRGTPGTGSQTNPAGTLDRATLPQRYLDKYGSRSVLGQKQVKMSPSAARRTFGESVDSMENYANIFIETLFAKDENPYAKIDDLIKVIEKYLKNNNIKEDANHCKKMKILREIKKPYQLPEQPKVKYKVKPGANRSINVDLMKKAEVPTSFKPAEEKLWGKYEKEQNARFSQERKNEVLDHLGGSDHAWEYVTETSRKKNNDIMYGNFGDSKKKIVRKEELKGDTLLFIADENGKKESILQSELSIKIANEMNKELFSNYFQEQETLQADKDPLFKRVANKIKPVIDYPDKPSSEGYPNTPPPEMVNGWHPEYGQRDSMYNKMDPQSAEVMQRVKKLDKVRKVVKKNPEGD